MFITTHAMIGALIAEQMPTHPYLGFIAGIATHFIADIIPHGDSDLYKGYISGSKKKMRKAVAYVMTDTLVSLFFVLFLFNTRFVEHRYAISLGIIGGVLPDFLVGVYELTHVKGLRWFHRVHFFFHNLVTARRGDIAFQSGIALQMMLLALVLTHV